MCTVSFIPLAGNDFLLTSNRDETRKRGLASPPQLLRHDEFSLLAPVDPLASGTWIAASDFGDVLCLLNGAFKKHKRQLPYRKSRGLVLLDYFKIANPEVFANEYDFQNIEPFTLILIHKSSAPLLFELRWDGENRFLKEMDNKERHLWSSATLYSDDLMMAKKNSFEQLLSDQSTFSVDEIISIHRKFLYEEWVKTPERIEEVATLSITCVEMQNKSLQMFYKDLDQPDLPIENCLLTLHER